MCLTSYA